MSLNPVYFAIRDDDTCYFTRPQDLESCYGRIWDTCPVSLSIVPVHACTKSGVVPKEHWTGNRLFPLEENPALVDFLREAIAARRVHATLHGYHHRDEPDGYEFVAGDDLSGKVRAGRKYLEELLGQPIQVFVPPHNSLGGRGYQAVVSAGLHISGIPSFKPSVRGWDPRVLAIGLRERLWHRRHGFRRPWPLVFPDGHRELPYHGLTPVVTLESLVAAFDRVRQNGGVFCLATHYWEFDRPGRGQPLTIRQILERVWDHVLSAGDQVRFCTLGELCHKTPEAAG